MINEHVSSKQYRYQISVWQQFPNIWIADFEPNENQRSNKIHLLSKTLDVIAT